MSNLARSPSQRSCTALPEPAPTQRPHRAPSRAYGHRQALALALIVGMLSAPACTERRIHITSEPAGALVHLNDTEVGLTPVEVDFTWFGVYDVRLTKPGFEPLITTAEAKAPLHEQPGIDLVMLAVPARKRTRVDWHFTLEPSPTDEAALLDRARELRAFDIQSALPK